MDKATDRKKSKKKKKEDKDKDEGGFLKRLYNSKRSKKLKVTSTTAEEEDKPSFYRGAHGRDPIKRFKRQSSDTSVRLQSFKQVGSPEYMDKAQRPFSYAEGLGKQDSSDEAGSRPKSMVDRFEHDFEETDECSISSSVSEGSFYMSDSSTGITISCPDKRDGEQDHVLRKLDGNRLEEKPEPQEMNTEQNAQKENETEKPRVETTTHDNPCNPSEADEKHPKTEEESIEATFPYPAGTILRPEDIKEVNADFTIRLSNQDEELEEHRAQLDLVDGSTIEHDPSDPNSVAYTTSFSSSSDIADISVTARLKISIGDGCEVCEVTMVEEGDGGMVMVLQPEDIISDEDHGIEVLEEETLDEMERLLGMESGEHSNAEKASKGEHRNNIESEKVNGSHNPDVREAKETQNNDEKNTNENDKDNLAEIHNDVNKEESNKTLEGTTAPTLQNKGEENIIKGLEVENPEENVSKMTEQKEKEGDNMTSDVQPDGSITDEQKTANQERRERKTLVKQSKNVEETLESIDSHINTPTGTNHQIEDDHTSQHAAEDLYKSQDPYDKNDSTLDISPSNHKSVSLESPDTDKPVAVTIRKEKEENNESSIVIEENEAKQEAGVEGRISAEKLSISSGGGNTELLTFHQKNNDTTDSCEKSTKPSSPNLEVPFSSSSSPTSSSYNPDRDTEVCEVLKASSNSSLESQSPGTEEEEEEEVLQEVKEDLNHANEDFLKESTHSNKDSNNLNALSNDNEPNQNLNDSHHFNVSDDEKDSRTKPDYVHAVLEANQDTNDSSEKKDEEGLKDDYKDSNTVKDNAADKNLNIDTTHMDISGENKTGQADQVTSMEVEDNESGDGEGVVPAHTEIGQSTDNNDKDVNAEDCHMEKEGEEDVPSEQSDSTKVESSPDRDMECQMDMEEQVSTEEYVQVSSDGNATSNTESPVPQEDTESAEGIEYIKKESSEDNEHELSLDLKDTHQTSEKASESPNEQTEDSEAKAQEDIKDPSEPLLYDTHDRSSPSQEQAHNDTPPPEGATARRLSMEACSDDFNAPPPPSYGTQSSDSSYYSTQSRASMDSAFSAADTMTEDDVDYIMPQRYAVYRERPVDLPARLSQHSPSPPKDIMHLASDSKVKTQYSSSPDSELAPSSLSKHFIYEKSHNKNRRKPLKQLKKRLGSLSKESKGDSKKEKNKEKQQAAAAAVAAAQEKEPGANKHDGETVDLNGEQLVKRSVVIHKDEKGFGLTVSGESPVFVQSVKDKGAAASAGVHQGDRIIKVNGTLVTNCHHTEVVAMIRSGSYVALTLLSRHAHPAGTKPADTPSGTPVPPLTPGATTDPSKAAGGDTAESNRISGPISVTSDMDQELRSQKITTIRLMYERLIQEYDDAKADSKKYPSETHLHKQLDEQAKLIKTLEQQLFSLTGVQIESAISNTGVVTSPSQRSPPSGLPPPGGTSSHRRTASNEGLEQIDEETRETHDPAALPPHPPIPPSQSASGPSKHRKHDSMPNPPLFEDAADTSPSGGASVRRTLSDSRKRGENDNTAAADNITMTSSLPASIYDEGTGDSPSCSPNASPSPASREAWLSDTEGGDVLSETPPDVPKHMKAVPASQVNVITMEDEDFSSNDEEQWDDHGPFEQFQKLKKHPAHLAVFLHYLICNNDPAPLLFYLSSEQYSQGGVKEMKKWAYEIYSTFLHEKAPLLVKSDERYNQSIQAVEHTLTTKLDNEVAMRALFQHARHIAHNDIDELLGEYRSRRSMGLANIYGEELHDGVMSKQEELSIVEKKLCPHFEKAFDDDSDRNRAIAYALATHLKSAGVSSSRGNGALDRCPTFNTKDRSFFKFGKKNTKKVSYFKGHSFAPSYFLSTTLCRHCDALIWGIGHQGVQCVNCDYVCHKHCMDKHNLDACQGTKKDKRKSIIEKIGGITRKPSTNNPTAIREAVGLRGSVTPNIPERLSVGESNKLSQVQRSKSLQAINQQASSSAAAKRTTFYVQHTPPRSPASPRSRHASNGGPPADTDMAADEEQVRNSQRVNQLVDRFSENAISSEVASSTPPRTHSPSPHETAENAEPSSSSFNDVANAEADALKALNHSESSSNSSLSRLESPSTSVAEGLNTHATSTAGAGGAGERASDSGLWSMSTSQSSMTSSMIQRQFDDSDFETDAELPPLSKSIPKDVIKKLKPKEKKRQEVINELFYTERAHMRNLKVMLRLFCQPMKEQVWIEPQFVKTLFPNMEEMIATHRTLNLAFKAKAADNPVVDEVADMLLDRFDGENGDRFKRAAATFCGNQTYALDMLRSKQRRDPKFAAYMQEQASHPLCRRLELKDFIPTVMQRLVKYPLLTESLLKYSVSNSSEHERLQRAQKCSKEILDYVNEAVSECENRQKLVEIQKRLDKKPIENSHNRQVQEYKAIDLTRKKMLHYGDLVWRIRGKNIELYVLLLEDILVLLQKQDDRLVLRCQTTNMQSALGDKEKFSHCPILKLSTLLVRDVATDRKAFFLISNNVDVGPQIYELVAPTLEERRKWYKYITQATQDQKGRDRLATHPPPTSSSSSNVPNRRSGSTVTPPRDTPSTQNTSTAPLSSSVPSSSSLPAEPDTPPPYPVHRDTTAESSDEDEDDEEHRLRKISNTGSDASGLHEGGEGRRRLSSGSSLDHVQHLEPQVAQQALIHPAEVVVTQQVLVQKADPVLTPYERLLQHDHHIEREMLEKKKLIAQMMQVSIKDFDHVAEMAREEKAEDSDAHSLLLASIHMSSELNKQIHNSLTQCVTTSCVDGAAAPDTAAAIQLPQVLTSGQLVENTQKLEQKLQHLMHLVQEREAETERLQAELDAARHKLQELSPRPHTQKGFFSADSNNSFSQLNNTSDEDLVDGVKRQRNEFSIAKASVLHQVRVEHCETIKVSSSPPALQPPPVVEARERAVSPIAVQHLTLATEEEQSEDSDTVTKDSEDSITKDSDEVVKDTNAVAKDSGDVSKDSVDSVATKSEDTAAGDKEEEDKSDNEKSEGKSEDSESESDSSDDDDDEEEGDEDEEEDDDEEEDEVEVRCDDGASILQETLTVPDIAYLEAVDSDDEEKDEVRLEITEDDTKNSGENKEKEGGETSL